MYAIILTGGKQLKAEVGQTLFVEKLDGEKDAEDGEKVQLGKLFVKGASGKAKIVKQGREKKIHVLRYKAKSNVRVHRGHRQPYTAVAIEAIEIK